MSRTDLTDTELAARIRAAAEAQVSRLAVADRPFEADASSESGMPLAPKPSSRPRRLLAVAAAVALLGAVVAAIVLVPADDGPDQLRTDTTVTSTSAVPVTDAPTWLAPAAPPFDLDLESVSYRAVPPLDAPAAQLFVPASGKGRVLVQLEPGDGSSMGVPGPMIQGHDTWTQPSTDGRSTAISWGDDASITARYRGMDRADAAALLDQLTWRGPDHLGGFGAPGDGSAVLVAESAAGQITRDAEFTYRTGDRFVALSTKVGEGPTFEQVEARFLAADLVPLDGTWSAYDAEDGELIVAWPDRTAWLAADDSVSEAQLRKLIPTLELTSAAGMRALERDTPGGEVATDPPVTSSTSPITTVPGETSRWTSEKPLSVPLERFGGSGATSLTALADGRPMGVLLWSSSCVPCIRSLEGFQAAAKDHPGIVLVLVAEQDSMSSVEALVEHLDLTLPILLDPEGALSGGWGVSAVPYAVAVGSDGRIRGSATGELDGVDEVAPFLDHHLGS